MRLRERFSFETCEIKTLSLPMPSGDSAEMRFMCHSIICSLPKACNYTGWMRMRMLDSEVGLAAGGALNLVSLIHHTCLGDRFCFQLTRVVLGWSAVDGMQRQ